MDPQGKTLAITGVGGFIGRRFGELAQARGMRVRGIDRDADACARAQATGFEVQRGDVTDPASAAWLAKGADVVLHTAAIVEEDGELAQFTRINVGGTRVVAEAAAAHSVPRFVHLSSVMVYGFDFPDEVTEEGPYPANERNPYCVTKLRSEGAAMAFHERGTQVCILRPGDVYGTGSVPWVERPLELMRRGLFVLPDGGRGIFNHVHVDNLAHAFFLALERDASGAPFNVTDGARTTFSEYFTRLARRFGLSEPRSAPSALLRPLFSALELGFRAAGRRPPARAAALDYISRPHAYSIERAKAELGYRPLVDLERGLASL